MATSNQILITVAGDDESLSAPPAVALRLILLELDVEGVELLTQAPPLDDAKGIGAIIGQLVVRLGSAIRPQAVLAAIRDWATQTGRTVRVTIDGDELVLTGASAAQQDRIVEAWLARHK